MNENPEKIYKCTQCNRIYKRQSDLTKHIRIVHLKILKISCKKNRKICPNCNRNITLSNFDKHYKSCIKGKQKLRHKDVQEIFNKCIIKDDKYICPICNKEFSKFGIHTHIWRMHTSEGKVFDPAIGYKNGTRISWNKGLTKDTDIRVAKGCKTYQLNAKLGKHKLPKKRYRNCATSTKYGWYKGIYCDSSWELAFLVYCLDNNKKVIREERGFNYIYKNKTHKYYPDFKVDNIYYEIKGRDNNPQITNIKLQAVKDSGFEIKILYSDEIKKYIRYVKNKYNINRVELLYEKNKKNNVFIDL